MNDLFDFEHPRQPEAVPSTDAVSLAYAEERSLGILPGTPAWIMLGPDGQPATVSNGPRLSLLDFDERAAPVYTLFTIDCERCSAPVTAEIEVGPYDARVECAACGQGYIVEQHLAERRDPEDDCLPTESTNYQ